MTFDELPFLARLVWDPVRALDLVDKHGKPDYSKIIPVTVIYIVLLLAAFGKSLATGMVFILISASFGQSMYRSFLKTKSVTAHEAASFAGELKYRKDHLVNETTLKQIQERRDVTLGIEPTDD